MYHPEQLVKLTNHDGINKGFKFKEGLNEDIYELNRKVECGRGGLYFCRFKNVDKWLCDYYGDAWIWKVEIPEGEKVIEYETKLKAKRIILKEPKKAYDNYELCKLSVQLNGYSIHFMKNQTPELCKLAVKQNGLVLEYVKDQTPEICKLAVLQDCRALHFVKEQTEELCKLAIQQNMYAIQFVKEQTPELCKIAVQQDGCALEVVKEQTPELCKIAVM